jgi:serine/threonine-protein kinase
MGAALSRPAPGGEPEVTIAFQPVGSGTSVLAVLAESMGGIPRVLLRDTDGPTGPDPMIQPASPEMPGLADRSAHLQLFGEIARGGMGAVLKGRDTDLGRDLAVKVLLDQHRNHPELIRRFVEEAQIAGQLQHPGVVPVYELGAFADRRPYFAMKLVKGRTLAAVLAGRRDVAEDRIGLLGTLLQVAQTIAYAHARGVIHRDLKPANVMVGSFGEVQVMDWGLAKVLPRGGVADEEAGRNARHETVIATARSGSGSDLSQAGSVLGTPAYMAPEQARGEVESVDQRADVFALGSILCEVLTGSPAFTGRTSPEIQRKAARGDLADAIGRLDACGADAELVALAKVCLAPERDDRPRDASAVVERLGGYLASIEQRLRAAELQRAAEHARAEEAVRRAQVERQRRRYQVGLAASLLVLSVVGGQILSYWMRRRQEREGRVAMAVQQAVFLRDQAVAEPNDVRRWEAARRGIDAAGRTLADLDAPAALKALEPLGQEVQAGLTAARRGPALIEALEKARIRGAQVGVYGGEQDYARAFRDVGLDLDAMTPAALGAAIRGLPEPAARAVIAALDDWAGARRVTPAANRPWRRPLEAARAADPDPFRDRIRAALLEADAVTRAATLRALVADPQAAELPPQSAVLLVRALLEQKDMPTEAMVAMLRAVAVRHPDDLLVNLAMAIVLMVQTPPAREEAVGYLRAARALRPDSDNQLSRVLKLLGRADEATAITMDLSRRRGYNWTILANALMINYQHNFPPAIIEETLAAGREAVRRFPQHPSSHAMLGTALLARGRRDEAIGELRAAIEQEPVLEQARAARAKTAKSKGVPYMPVPDPLDQELGTVMPQVLHGLLGNALRDQGDFVGALEEFRASQVVRDASGVAKTAGSVTQAESMARLAGRLDAVLQGTDRPTGVEELRTFAIMAYYVRHYDAATSLFAEAIEREAKPEPQDFNARLAEDRYNGACAAALAGSGQGQDAPPRDDPARAQRRHQALQWLRENLASKDSHPQAYVSGGIMLPHWEHDPDLAGVRDAQALEALPEDERQAWRSFWAEIERRVWIEMVPAWRGTFVP